MYAIDLFRTSEVFITEQAEAYSRPVIFVGEGLAGEPPPWARYLLHSRQRRTIDCLRASTPLLIHAHFGVAIPRALRLGRRLGIPVVVTLHGFDVTRGRLSSLCSMRPNLMRYAARRRHYLAAVDRCYAVSTYIRARALAAGAPPRKTLVHHIGTRIARLPSRGAISQLDNNIDFKIVHVARLVEIKGTSVLIRAVAAAKEALHPLRLRIVGEGPLRPALEQLTRQLGLAENEVQFVGAISHRDVLVEIAAADVICLPSLVLSNGRAEGLGMVMLEAAAIGTPVIASRGGGIGDFLVPDETGLIVPPGDPDALAAALVRVRSDPSAIAAIAEAARRLVTQNFDISLQTARLERQFEVLANHRDSERDRSQP